MIGQLQRKISTGVLAQNIQNDRQDKTRQDKTSNLQLELPASFPKNYNAKIHFRGNGGDEATLNAYREGITTAQRAGWWNSTDTILDEHYRQAFPKPGSSVLDLGAGSGRDMVKLASDKEMNYEVYGVEPGQKLIDEMIVDPNVTKVIPDIKNRVYNTTLPELDKVDRKFNGILSTAVLQHVPEDQLPACAKRMKDILEPEGTALITVPVNAKDHEAPIFPGNRDGQNRLFNPLPERKLREIFEPAGFKRVDSWVHEDGLGRKERETITVLFKVK